MRSKIFKVVMVIFTIIIAVNLFISLICGAPTDGDGIERYVLCALGVSVLLPTCFTLFFLIALDLSERLEKYESMEAEEERKAQEKSGALKMRKDDQEIPVHIPISVLVNALAKEKNLTPEEKERLLAYLEEL